MQKLISIIILSYNSEKDIKDCLDSLIQNFDKNLGEIIVFDNDSKDKTKEILEKYKKLNFIKIIFNDKNDGFAIGNNKASKYAEGKYIILLNADTISDFNVFKNIVDFMEKNQNIGVVGPKCIDELGVTQESFGFEFSILKEIIGKTFMSLYLEKIPLVKKIKNKILFKNKSTEVDWVGGACAVIRKDIWDKIGGLDPNFFFSNGDMIDFCYQVRKLDFKCVYYPDTTIIHKGSRIVTQNLQTRILGLKNGYLGSLYFLKKHKKSFFYIYLTKMVYVLLSLFKGFIALFLSIFNKGFRDVSYSHLYVSFFMMKNFFKNE